MAPHHSAPDSARGPRELGELGAHPLRGGRFWRGRRWTRAAREQQPAEKWKKARSRGGAQG